MTKDLKEIIEDCPNMELTGSDCNYDAILCNSNYECKYQVDSILPNAEKELPNYCWKHMAIPLYDGNIDG